MNDQQDDLLSFLVELCLVIPKATLLTLIELLEPSGLKKYEQHLSKLDPIPRKYFETTFRSQEARATQQAVFRRLFGMMRVPAFRRMFEAPHNRFDIGREIDQGKVILINTKRALLGEHGCQLFGRFFLSRLMQVAMTRGEHSKTVYCYVDECQDYISEDERIAEFLDKARKRRVAMILATQRLEKIKSTNVQNALMNVAIRLIATGNEMERGVFQCFVRRTTSEPIEARVRPAPDSGRMSDAEFAELKQQMRERYCGGEKYESEASATALLEEQLAIVGRLWKQLDDTIKAAGGVRDGATFSNALNISREDRKRLNELRRDRNARLFNARYL